jgi:hypothetical protein
MGLNAQYTTTTPAFGLTDAPQSGYQYSATDPSAAGSRPPACFLQATTQNIRWTIDGSAPTATYGMLLVAGADPFFYAGPLNQLRFVQVASGAVLNVTYSDLNNAPGQPGPAGSPGPTGASGVVQAVVAGTSITVDNTDPANPVVNATGASVTKAAVLAALGWSNVVNATGTITISIPSGSIELDVT